MIEPSTESTIEIFSRAPGGNKPSEDLSSVLFIVKSFISISLLFCEMNMQQKYQNNTGYIKVRQNLTKIQIIPKNIIIVFNGYININLLLPGRFGWTRSKLGTRII